MALTPYIRCVFGIARECVIGRAVRGFGSLAWSRVQNRGGYCNASGPLGIDLPRCQGPLETCASREAVFRLSGAVPVGEGPLRTRAYLRGCVEGCGVTFLTVGAALWVGLRAPSPRRGAG